MLITHFFDFLENISLAEELTYQFYTKVLSKDICFPNSICFVSSLHAPILLQRSGFSRPCVSHDEKAGPVVITLDPPDHPREIRDRYFPTGSAGLLIRKHYDSKEDIRELLLESIKPFFKKEVRYLIESRTEGLFDIESNKKFSTFNSWVLGKNEVEMVALCLIPEITEEMKNFCDEKKYIGFRTFLKPEFQDLFIFYQAFFNQLILHFSEI